MKTRKIALFGGSFDPVHRAHLAIAEEAMKQCDLDRVIFIPCPQSPHKDEEPGASAEHRLAMLRIATEGFRWAEVSTWELDRDEESPAYSWITATHFADEFPETDLFWITGSDQWNKLESWSRPQVLASLLTFIVFPRGASPVSRPDFRFIPIDFSIEGSSTEARRRLAQGTSVTDLLPAAVSSYIEEQSLYKPASR